MKTIRWHQELNKAANHDDKYRFIYDAIATAGQIDGISKGFEDEYTDSLRTTHKQCSLSPTEKLDSNFLICCYGTKTKECEFLTFIDDIPEEDMTIDHKARAKAFTCCCCIVKRGGDPANTGFILDQSDIKYWNNVHESLAFQGEQEHE